MTSVGASDIGSPTFVWKTFASTAGHAVRLRFAQVMVCTTQAHDRTNGIAGTFFDDVTSFLSQSTPAIYVEGYGATCLLSDIVTWGGDPSQYTLAPYKVDGTGEKTPAGMADVAWGAIYPYYAGK